MPMCLPRPLRRHLRKVTYSAPLIAGSVAVEGLLYMSAIMLVCLSRPLRRHLRKVTSR